MSTERIKNNIRSFLSTRFLNKERPPGDGSSLFAEGILDSFRLMEMIAFLEKEFSIHIGMSEVTVDNFESIETITDLVMQKRKKAGKDQ